MKKIYFACSIRGGRNEVGSYAHLVEFLKPRCDLLTENFADEKLTSEGMNKPSKEIWSVDLQWIKDSDAVIAEVTNPSLGVGYEIAKAEEWGKPVLALFKDEGTKKLSAMIDGSSGTATVKYRTIDEAERAILQFLVMLDSNSRH